MAKAKAKNNKLIQEIIILVVVLSLIGGYFLYQSLSKVSKVRAVPVHNLDTTFDTNALNLLQQKDGSYPDVTPNSTDLGKTDPYVN